MSPSRKPAKPVKKPTAAEETRHQNVLLEKLSSDFRAFGEGLDIVRKKLEGTFDQVGRNTEALGRVADRLSALEGRVAGLENRVAEGERRLSTVELRLTMIDGKLSNLVSDSATIKKDLDILKTDVRSFAQRLEAVEAK